MLISSWKQAPQPGSSGWDWPDFSPRELACRCRGRFCAGEYWHDPQFLDALQNLRGRVQRPLRILSGHRCALWNAHVGGAPLSQHKKIAVDIALSGHSPIFLSRAAWVSSFVGQGFYTTFIHLDRGRQRQWFGPRAREFWEQNWIR